VEGDILNLRGSGLWELSLGVVLIVVAAGALVLSSSKMTERAYVQRTLKDMSAILEACRQYDALQGGWPLSLSVLREVLPQVESNNVWGYPFVIVSEADLCGVETDVPTTAGGHLRLSTSRKYGASARLLYEKRNVYGQ
jgi:type II secretory pathway pseudopilin PulG